MVIGCLMRDRERERRRGNKRGNEYVSLEKGSNIAGREREKFQQCPEIRFNRYFNKINKLSN